MGVFKSLAVTLAFVSVGVGASAIAKAAAPEFKTVMASAPSAGNLGIAADHGAPEQIAQDLKDFTEVYRDYAELFTAQDFRTPFSNKLIKAVDFEKPEIQLKLANFKKKIDQIQKMMRSYLLLQSVRVSDKQMPRIYKLAKLAAERLELRGNFNVFILNSPSFNAFTYSYNTADFDVVIHSGAAEKLSDEALLALLGHEMGHVKDQAILMQLVLAADFESRAQKVSGEVVSAGLYDDLFHELPSGLGGMPNLRALMKKAAMGISVEGGTIASFTNAKEAAEFGRNCELNADRAAVIATQAEGPALKLLAALAHGSKVLTEDFDVEELIKQVSEVLASNEEVGQLEELMGEQESHPFPVVRLIHARNYAASKSFKDLLASVSQSPFGKELDLLGRNVARLVELTTKFKKYQAGDAETDDMLLKLKTEKFYTSNIEKTGTAAATLGALVLLQLEGSDLTKKDNGLFATLVEKAKADKSGVLRQVAIPSVLELLQKLAKDAQGEAADELKAKIKVLEVLKDLG